MASNQGQIITKLGPGPKIFFAKESFGFL